MKLRQCKYFAKGQIPDGYFGDWKTVDFYYHPSSGKTMAAHGMGSFFTYHTPPADSIQEAMWLLEHHPSSNVRYLTH